MQKKNVQLCTVLFICSVLFFSCQTPARYVNTNREKKTDSAKIVVGEYIEIISVSGTELDYPIRTRDKPRAIFMQGGTYVVRLRYRSTDGFFKNTTPYIDLDCTFESGKYYLLSARFQNENDVVFSCDEIEPRKNELELFR